jgi:CheY-like chemotaxis protein
MRVLQVDPDPAWCTATAAWLEQFFGDVDVETVASAAEALQVLDKRRPDLVLAAHPLPAPGGVGFAALVKARPHPPTVVVLAASSAAGLELQCSGAGVDLLLEKRHLQSRLLAFLQRRFPKVWADGVVARSRASLRYAAARGASPGRKHFSSGR